MILNNDNGIIEITSNHSVDETVRKLIDALAVKGATLFALVDHSGEAKRAGMAMLPTKLLIFGNPRAGTPIMLSAPLSAIDLPLKLLVWEDPSGKVRIAYNSPAYLQARHGFAAELLHNIKVAEVFAAQAAE